MFINVLNENDSAIVKSGKHWNKKLNDFCYDVHRKSFKNIYVTTNVIKLRSFQYRLLHNKIFCNNILYYWKKVDTQYCEWCINSKQDIIHLLWECPKTQLIWKHVGNEMCNDIEVEFNCKNVIYNMV